MPKSVSRVRGLSIIGTAEGKALQPAKSTHFMIDSQSRSDLLQLRETCICAISFIYFAAIVWEMSAVPPLGTTDNRSAPTDEATDPASPHTGRQPTLTGCPWHDVNEMLQAAGLRPTRQRMALGWLLFGKGARHLTAEMLYEEATLAKVPVSLATVYNTLNQLTDAGLLRQVSVDGTKTYFDTNVTAHHHLYLEHNHELVDIPDPHLVLSQVPDVPDGYEISRIDMVVRLRKKR